MEEKIQKQVKNYIGCIQKTLNIKCPNSKLELSNF